MELYSGEFINSILKKIKRQTNQEKYKTIYPFVGIHNITMDFETIQFPEDCCCFCPIPLDKIYGTIEVYDTLFILFENFSMHILYKDGKHDVLLLEDRNEHLNKLKLGLTHFYDESKN